MRYRSTAETTKTVYIHIWKVPRHWIKFSWHNHGHVHLHSNWYQSFLHLHVPLVNVLHQRCFAMQMIILHTTHLCTTPVSSWIFLFQMTVSTEIPNMVVEKNQSQIICHTPKIHQIQKLRFLGISRYKFKLRFFWYFWTPSAAARHQGMSQRMQGKILGFIYPGVLRGFIYPGVYESLYWQISRVTYSWIKPRNCSQCDGTYPDGAWQLRRGASPPHAHLNLYEEICVSGFGGFRGYRFFLI